MGWGALIGAAISAAGSMYSANKAKKSVKQATPLDVPGSQREAIQSNEDNRHDIEALIKSSNSFTQKQNLSLLEQAVPGYGSMAKALSNRAAESIANPYKLPDDFTQNLNRLAAERGINVGARGQAGDFSLLRDFGVNSLQYGQQQIGQAQSIISMLAGLGKVNPLSPLAFYVTPQQSLAAQAQQQGADQAAMNAQAQANNYANSQMWNSFAQLGAAAGSYYSNRGGGTGGSAPSTGSAANTLF
jgi:hypothetical protein